MPEYRYRAKDESGRWVSGVLYAAGETQAVRRIRSKKLYPVSIARQENEWGIIDISFGKVKAKDLAIFCQQFATAVNAGIPILTSLDILRRQIHNTKLKRTAQDLYREVQKGNSLSSVMATHRDVFPEMLVNLTEVGEMSGTLGNVMDRMAGYYQKEYRTNQRIRNALVYPILVAVVALFLMVLLTAVVLPTFVGMFGDMGSVLPLSTQVLIYLSRFGAARWREMLAFIVIFFGVGKMCSQSEAGRRLLDGIRLRAPIIGSVNKRTVTARFARTLGMLLESGIPLMDALEATGKVLGNSVIRGRLNQVQEHIKIGEGLAQPLKGVKAFPPMLMHMVRVGEETGTLDYMLSKTADIYDNEVENIVTRLITLIEPAIIVVMAVVVGFIVIAIVIPMLDLMTNIGL